MKKYDPRITTGVNIVLNETLPPNTIHASPDVYGSFLKLKEEPTGLKVDLKK